MASESCAGAAGAPRAAVPSAGLGRKTTEPPAAAKIVNEETEPALSGSELRAGRKRKHLAAAIGDCAAGSYVLVRRLRRRLGRAPTPRVPSGHVRIRSHGIPRGGVARRGAGATGSIAILHRPNRAAIASNGPVRSFALRWVVRDWLESWS